MKQTHSEKQNPASKPQTKNMLNVGLKRAGDTSYVDYKPSDKLTRQSAGARRRGENAYAAYPDATTSNGFESTGKTKTGSRKGSR